MYNKQISADKQLKTNINGWTEVIAVASSKHQQPASALRWISCQTLNSLSLKTNNHEGVKLSCHHSFFFPSSLIFPFSFYSNPLHLSPPLSKADVSSKQCEAISKQIAVITQWMMHNHPLSTRQESRRPGSLIDLRGEGGRLKAPRQLTDGE